MQHLDEGTIHAWLDGALAGDDAAAAARHASECRDCAALVAEARGMIAATSRVVSALDDVPAGVIPTARQTPAVQHSMWRRLRFTPARAALAATALLTAGTLFASRHNEVAKESAPVPMTAQAPASVSADSHVKSNRREVADTSGVATPSPISGATATAATARERAANSPTAVSAKAPPPSIGPMKPSSVPARAGAAPAAQAADVAAVPVAGAPVAAAPASPRAENKAVDSRLAQRAAVDSLASVDVNRAERRAFNRVQQLEAVTGAAAGLVKRADVQGCYELSADSASTLRGIPLRFALQHRAGTTDYVVRALSTDNRLDSLVSGGSWRSFAGDRATVSFSGTVEREAVVLQFSATGPVAQASAGGRLVHIGIQRVDCRP
jgi:hypothetical protein